MSKTKTKVRVGNRSLELSNLDKVFYPETGFTKGDVIDYYKSVAPVLLPHLKGRPATLKRYPDGVEGPFFYEKRCPPHRPEWVKTITMRRQRDQKDIAYCAITNAASLIWTVNLANLELHASLAKQSDLKRPTSLVFDLDPGEPADVVTCAEVAHIIKKLLDGLGLESVVKTSGSKGLQLYVPLNTKVTYDETRPFAHAVALTLEERHPDLIVSKMAKDLRTDKVFIDWSQNDDHKTTVVVYSLRARPRPTVSTPVTWNELKTATRTGKAEKLTFEAGEVLKRVNKRGDLFEPVRKLRQKLPPVPDSW
jgi:bifunctional non-homologous end joining protein LigD